MGMKTETVSDAMTDDTMIEKVARALAGQAINEEFSGGPKARQAWIDINWPRYVDDAHAAIQAFREPNRAMRRAFESGYHWHSFEQGWEDAIDAALSESPEMGEG